MIEGMSKLYQSFCRVVALLPGVSLVLILGNATSLIIADLFVKDKR